MNKPLWTRHYVHTHPTLFFKVSLFSEDGQENYLCPHGTHQGSQRLSTILPSLLISGIGQDNTEQQLGCKTSCPPCCSSAETSISSGEAEHGKGQQTDTATSHRADLSLPLVRCTQAIEESRPKSAPFCFYHLFPANCLEVHLAACFCCKSNPFSFVIATEDDIFSQALPKLPLLLAVLACI